MKNIAKVSQCTSQNILWGSEPMNLQKHPVRKEVERSDETGGQAYDFWLCFIKSRLKTLSKNHQQIIGEENMDKHSEGLPIWSRKGTKNNNYPASENPNLVRSLLGRRYRRAEIERGEAEAIQVNGGPEGGQYGDNRERRSRGYTSKRGARGGRYGDHR